MRVFPWLCGLILACNSGSKPSSTATDPADEITTPAELAVVSPTSEVAQGGGTPEIAAPVKAGSLPPGKPMVDFPTVAIVGHGIRFELNPPFQAARMPGLYASENPDVLVISWWDVGHEAAGRNGRAGLYNVGVIPAEMPRGSPSLLALSEQGEKGIQHRLQVGETGTAVRLPGNHSGLGGMGTLSVGPADPRWRVQVGTAEPVELPDKEFLHSWDPASGHAIHLDRTPQKPFGDWPALEAPPSEAATAAP